LRKWSEVTCSIAIYPHSALIAWNALSGILCIAALVLSGDRDESRLVWQLSTLNAPDPEMEIRDPIQLRLHLFQNRTTPLMQFKTFQWSTNAIPRHPSPRGFPGRIRSCNSMVASRSRDNPCVLGHVQ
jgi:hypothetical protein